MASATCQHAFAEPVDKLLAKTLQAKPLPEALKKHHSSYRLEGKDDDGDIEMIDVSGQSVTDHQAGESFKKLREPAHLYGVAGSDLDVCINFLKLVKVHAETAGPRCTLYCTELEYHLKIYDGLVERSFLLPNDCYFPYSRDFKSRVKTYLEPTVKLKFLKMIGLHFSHGYRLAISHNQQRVEVSIDGTNQDDSIDAPTTTPFRLSPFENLWCVLYEENRYTHKLEWIGSAIKNFEDLLSKQTFMIHFETGISLIFKTEICTEHITYGPGILFRPLKKLNRHSQGI
ncbi:uncharacterized protein LOC111255261 [Varroa destructor]|uniref:Uncharacterized protein n=1 Tax=Varroa destructor TaxID=109461 RepID=A0A7M7L2A1_VARDE|nr:uncharacterized protein LOC111255261 [Varroa destructor]XP_022672762.1 uncharacterized protein LOC111255261 [Varroa destructor]